MASPAPSGQQEAIDFLSLPRSHGLSVEKVERIETHAAIVFLAGSDAFKMKKAVDLGYLDFSTLEKRRLACEREIDINRPHAPAIYTGTRAITREADGSLTIGGRGEPVEWVVAMRRFADEDLLEEVAKRGALPDELSRELGVMVAQVHRRLPPLAGAAAKGAARIASVASQLAVGLSRAGPSGVQLGARLALSPRSAALLERRGAEGFVRRCHGDLHLANIVVLGGRPVPFDALEFDEELATVDVLYDLAFLLMDLLRHGDGRAANIVLDRYLLAFGDDRQIDGLALLPHLMALRAAVRTVVLLDRSRQLEATAREEHERQAEALALLALSLVEPAPARLVAVGGFSGSGKSTVAASIAPLIAPAPGALHLRSDLERKVLHGAAETERLPEAAYSAAAGREVYARMLLKARLALAAGHSVVLDAVFGSEAERAAAETLAAEAQCRFDGLWLTADREALLARVAARSGDASDATGDVVDLQLARGAGRVAWTPVDARGGRGATAAAAAKALGL